MKGWRHILCIAVLQLGLEWLEERCSRLCGKKPTVVEANPAALVGSFKRYKWRADCGGAESSSSCRLLQALQMTSRLWWSRIRQLSSAPSSDTNDKPTGVEPNPAALVGSFKRYKWRADCGGAESGSSSRLLQAIQVTSRLWGRRIWQLCSRLLQAIQVTSRLLWSRIRQLLSAPTSDTSDERCTLCFVCAIR